MAAQFKFLKGNYSGLNSVAITEGQLLVTKDTRELFIDVDASTRIKIGDFTMIGTLAELEALDASTVPTSRLYYVEDTNIFCKSTGSAWTQINKDTGATSVEVVGEGNAITDASYDPATRKLTLTKGETFATKAYIGDIPETSEATDIVGYIQEKTAGIATDTALEELTGRVADAEGEIDALQEASAKHVEKEEGKSLVADTEITKLAGVSEGANKVEKSETNGNIKVDGEEIVVYTHKDKHTIDEVDGLQDALDGKQAAGDYAAEEHTHVAADITDLDDTIKGYDYATKSEAQGYADAKDEAIAAAKKAGDDAASALDAYKGEMTTALADKQDVIPENTYDAHGAAAKALGDAKKYTDEEIAKIPAQTDYTVTITENTDDTTVAKTYVFSQNGAEIGSIKLAKELVVTSGTVKEVETVDVPYAGAKVGDKYIELVIANQDTPIYVPAKDLVDIYTAKDGATEVQIAISNTNEVSATLVNGGVTEEKLAEGVKTKLNKVWEEVGVAQGLVDGLANGQVKTNKEAIENITKEGGLIATAKSEAISAAETKAGELDAALKTELQGEIDGDVKAAIDAEVLRANGAYDTKGAAADAQSAAEATAAGALATARTEITAEIDADVKALADGQVATNKADIEALTKTVGDNASAANKAVEDLAAVVYTQEQVDELIAEACSWGTFGE